jgi:hypothetical protein
MELLSELLTVLLKVLVGIALAVTVGALVAGVVAMARGGSFNARWGNKLMRLRVIVQGAAVALLAVLAAVTYG